MKTNNLITNPTKKTSLDSLEKLTRQVKEKALSLGAHLVGIAPMERMDKAPPGTSSAAVTA